MAADMARPLLQNSLLRMYLLIYDICVGRNFFVLPAESFHPF